jgi:lipoprotein-anchoring transpeptidase ErfK/SrfK
MVNRGLTFLLLGLSFGTFASAQEKGPSPNPSGTPFVVDTTGAESSDTTSSPTPTPDTSFPAKPFASPPAKPGATSEPGVARAEPVAPRDIITRLQIFLDQHSFGPGKIDGGWGEFTAKALLRYQMANGLPATGQIDAALQEELSKIFPIYTTYTLTADDFHYIGQAPTKPSEAAKAKVMPYRSVEEFLGERFHSDEDFIVKLNKDKKFTALKPGETVRVPNVPPFRIEDVKEVGHLPVENALLKRSIKIDTRYRMLDIYEGDKLLCSYPITPGSTKLPAPIGTWKIIGIATLPWFRWDEAMLMHGVQSDDFFNIPPGPRNPVGIAWIGLNKRGIGIHGTNNPDTIGRSGSHGCIRLANWDAARVIHQVTPGMTVQIF